jgi:hypothetical protein
MPVWEQDDCVGLRCSCGDGRLRPSAERGEAAFDLPIPGKTLCPTAQQVFPTPVCVWIRVSDPDCPSTARLPSGLAPQHAAGYPQKPTQADTSVTLTAQYRNPILTT